MLAAALQDNFHTTAGIYPVTFSPALLKLVRDRTLQYRMHVHRYWEALTRTARYCAADSCPRRSVTASGTGGHSVL